MNASAPAEGHRTDSVNDNKVAAEKPGSIRISVNGEAVAFTDKHQTGESIKTAAIAAGIPIQPDFVLSEVREHGEQKIVADDKKVTVKDGDEFWAIPGDDNS